MITCKMSCRGCGDKRYCQDCGRCQLCTEDGHVACKDPMEKNCPGFGCGRQSNLCEKCGHCAKHEKCGEQVMMETMDSLKKEYGNDLVIFCIQIWDKYEDVQDVLDCLEKVKEILK